MALGQGWFLLRTSMLGAMHAEPLATRSIPKEGMMHKTNRLSPSSLWVSAPNGQCCGRLGEIHPACQADRVLIRKWVQRTTVASVAMVTDRSPLP